ncbi:GNAT family N-acetyltransferase [Oscillospiraceae bacterium MB08-C2-2]|nr:GNAT family N-acetyltransferase [Oscillospiraceae bacterium MB08-C2-2]
MITLADSSMEPALKSIWVACFGDSPDYVDFYFQRMFRPEEVLVALEEGEPAAMLTMRSVPVRAEGKSYKAAYIFAVATHPDHQGKGLSTTLMEAAHSHLIQKGFALSMLAPATDSLFDFYGKRGYSTAFETTVLTLRPGSWQEQPGAALVPLSVGRMLELRRRHFASSRFFVDWGAEYLAYILEECRMLGGEALEIGGEGFAVCYPVGERVEIKELVLPWRTLDQAMTALHRQYGAREYSLRLWPGEPIPGENRLLPYAMVRWYDETAKSVAQGAWGKAPYIAHIMD